MPIICIVYTILLTFNTGKGQPYDSTQGTSPNERAMGLLAGILFIAFIWWIVRTDPRRKKDKAE